MPKSLSNLKVKTVWPVVGHQPIVSYLQRITGRGETAHAYLFSGPGHVGKRTVAEFFVAALVCEQQPADAVPCGQCRGCQQLKSGLHPDVIWLEREINEKTGVPLGTIGIEQVRELQHRLQLHSFFNHYKVAVIPEAERLSLEAANALLKTLEEPTARTVIILLTTSLEALPFTIASRCLAVKFLPVAEQLITNHLVSQQMAPNQARAVAALSFGLPGLAIGYQLNPELLDERAAAFQEFVRLHRLDEFDRFTAAQALVGRSDAGLVNALLTEWSLIVRDILLTKIGNPELAAHQVRAIELNELSQRYSTQGLVEALQSLSLGRAQLAANVSPRLIVENFLLTLPAAH